jgi:PAS domain S-box-containing protein
MDNIKLATTAMISATKRPETNARTWRVLMVEDSADDELLIIRRLKQDGHGVSHVRVSRAEDFRRLLKDGPWDVVLADYNVPGFGAMPALEILGASGQDLPLIVVSGHVGDEAAAEVMRAGAGDFVSKDKLSRLAPVISRTIAAAETRREAAAARVSLRESEEKYRSLVDSADDFIFMIGPDFRVISANRAANRLFKKDPGGISGKSIFDLFPPGMAEGYRASLKHVFDTGEAISRESEMAAGQHRSWISAILSPVLGPDGKVMAVTGISRDISEAKRSAQEIKRISDVQSALNRLLKISLFIKPLEWKLNSFLKELLATPFLSIEAKGGIWLEYAGILRLSAWLGLSDSIINGCAMIPPGKCLCGRSYLSQKAIFKDELDEEHDLSFADTVPHGHYCLPIIAKGRALGVLNLYVKKGHRYDMGEAQFLNSAASVLANIIEDVRIRADLEKSERKYRTLINSAMDGIFVADRELRVEFFNHAFASMAGFDDDKVRTDGLAGLVHPDDRMALKGRINGLLDGKSVPANIDFQLIAKGGDIRSVSASLSILAENGQPPRIQGIVHDVTERKALQDKIRRSKTHYEQVIDAIDDAIIAIDDSLAVASCNRAFAAKVGLPIEKVKGRPASEVLTRYESDELKDFDALRLLNEIKSINKDGRNGSTSFIEKYTDRREQDHYHVVSVYPAQAPGGYAYQYVVTIRDITKEKGAEERVRRLSEINQKILDNIPVSIAMLDRSGTIVAANRMAKRLMDRPEKPIIGQKLTDSMDIRSRPELLGRYERLITEGEAIFFDNLIYHKSSSDEERSLNIIAVPTLGPDGQVEGAISMALDNTEAMRAKERLNLLNRELEQKVEERTRELHESNKKLAEMVELRNKFLADASHELRTPLTVIQGNLDLAMLELSNQSASAMKEYYEQIIEEIDRMGTILSELTMLNRIDDGAEQLEYEPVNLGGLVDMVGKSLKVLADQKKIALIYKKAAKNVMIMGDESKLEKMLLNIVRNGIKYTNPKGRVRIWTEECAHEACLFVEDNGIGIPPDDLPHIFERFYRVDKSRSRKEGGTGLGLAIARWITQSHGGSIEVESEEGRGSKFTIRLPYEYRARKKQERML